MVAPVVGPSSVTEDFSKFYRRRARYKQAPPFTLCLPYTCLIGKRTLDTGNNQPAVASRAETIRTSILSSTQRAQLKSLLYEKLMASISDRASMGENLFELHKSLQTIAVRAEQLLRFTKAVKRGRFGDAAAILRTPAPVIRHPVKEQANNWLEYHLGIAPVIGDIFSAMDVLQSPIKNIRSKGKASIAAWNISFTPPSGQFSPSIWYDCTGLSGHCQADVAVTNPNLYLANKLGVINPAQVLWQLTPLSFVLDWFVNVEQFLGTFTDFLGLTVQNASATYKYTGQWRDYWAAYGWRSTVDVYGFERELGVPVPSLVVRPYKALGWQRGLTAISLLVPALKSLDTTNLKKRDRPFMRDSFSKSERRSDFRDRANYSGVFS